MECFILQRNIATFRRMLERETDLNTRRTLRRLLADAETDLAQLEMKSTAPSSAADDLLIPECPVVGNRR